MRGALGQAAARLAAAACSRGRESVRDPSLVENLAPEKKESRDVAMKRDALVSDSITMHKELPYLNTIQYGKKERTYPSTCPSNFIEPHEICPEQNIGDVVWKKTAAGDMAAVACPADASGTETARIALCFVSFSLYKWPRLTPPQYADY